MSNPNTWWKCSACGTEVNRKPVIGNCLRKGCHGTMTPMRLKPAPDPNARLARSMRQAYRSTDQWKVDQLLAEQSKWQRRQTIAVNKLADVRKRIDELLTTLAAPKLPPLEPTAITEPKDKP